MKNLKKRAIKALLLGGIITILTSFYTFVPTGPAVQQLYGYPTVVASSSLISASPPNTLWTVSLLGIIFNLIFWSLVIALPLFFIDKMKKNNS